MVRANCDAILSILPTFYEGLTAPLENIPEDHLNHVFASHKMTIGQIAIHCTAWMTYFLTNPKPWDVVPWTCKIVEYPLKLTAVHEIIDEGFATMRLVLSELDDTRLEVDGGKKGDGYIISRLLHHILAHSNQMSYLRQLLEPDWGFGGHFGDMASALIALPYHTARDLKVRGF